MINERSVVESLIRWCHFLVALIGLNFLLDVNDVEWWQVICKLNGACLPQDNLIRRRFQLANRRDTHLSSVRDAGESWSAWKVDKTPSRIFRIMVPACIFWCIWSKKEPQMF